MGWVSKRGPGRRRIKKSSQPMSPTPSLSTGYRGNRGGEVQGVWKQVPDGTRLAGAKRGEESIVGDGTTRRKKKDG